MQEETNPTFVKRIEFHLPWAQPGTSGITKSELCKIIASALEEDAKISSRTGNGEKLAGSPVTKPRLSKAELLNIIASLEEDTETPSNVSPAFEGKKTGTSLVKPSISLEQDARKLRASPMDNSPTEEELSYSQKIYKSIIKQAMVNASEKQKPKP